jgi:hypothetical protein
MRIKLDIKKTGHFVFLIFTFFVILLPRVSPISELLSQIILIFTIPLLLFFLKGDLKYLLIKNKLVLIFLFFSIPFSIIISLHQMRMGPLIYIIYFFYSFLFALYLTEKKEVSLKVANFFFGFLTFFLLINFFIKGINPKAVNQFLYHSSRNIVSAIFLFSTMFLYLSNISSNNKLKLYPSIILIIISVLSYGRTGIILSFVMFIIIYLFVFFNHFTFKKIIIYVFISAILLIVLFRIHPILINETNLSRGLESKRFMIYSSYLEKINLNNVFTGYNYKQIPVVKSLNNNPHNSFIVFHYNLGFGLILFLLMVFLYFYIGLINFSLRINFIMCFSFIFLIRALIDTIAFIGMYDFIFFYSLILINNEVKYKFW